MEIVPLVPKVLHFSELILPYLAALPIVKKLPQATYHAPCHLSRRLKGCASAGARAAFGTGR